MSDTPIHAARVWWDAGQRLWTLQWLDSEGNEIGDTIYDPHKGPLVADVDAHDALFDPVVRYIGTRNAPATEPWD